MTILSNTGFSDATVRNRSI